MFFTYVIQSLKTNQIYIGQTNDLEDRLLRHNSNRNKWTKNKGPWSIIFSKSFETRSEAVRLERKLKAFKSRERVISWIQNNK
ncbi:MAG: GIY-YIG nuclease family protein [Bacteroidetes bacterium]|nr:MAG: GIY-YIG nuclease family protein [Bacteroidota bacterium]